MKSWKSKELKCCWNAVKRNYASAKNDVYKRETALSVVALAFLLFVIIPQILECGWASPALRTMMFTLFGIVGLMGFSISIKRHEEDRKRNKQTLVEHRERQEAGQIERMHSCIQQLSNKSPLAVFLGALSEMETMFKNLDEASQKLLLRSICVFIQTVRMWKNFDTSRSDDLMDQEKFHAQMNKINFAFKTLKRLSNQNPIKVLKENKINTKINLRRMTFKGEDMKLEGEDLTGCDFEGTKFEDTSIIDCKFDKSMKILSAIFKHVRIDKSDLGTCFEGFSFENHVELLKQLRASKSEKSFLFYTDQEPINLPFAEANQNELLELMREDKLVKKQGD